MNNSNEYNFNNGINYCLTVGFCDRKSNMQNISNVHALQLIEDIAFKYFDEFSITRIKRCYRDDRGTKHCENGVVLDVLNVNTDTVIDAAKEIKTALNQSSVLISTEYIYYIND